jgi:hypothetical protein
MHLAMHHSMCQSEISLTLTSNLKTIILIALNLYGAIEQSFPVNGQPAKDGELPILRVVLGL